MDNTTISFHEMLGKHVSRCNRYLREVCDNISLSSCIRAMERSDTEMEIVLVIGSCVYEF
jgi:hypothetical protein